VAAVAVLFALNALTLEQTQNSTFVGCGPCQRALNCNQIARKNISIFLFFFVHVMWPLDDMYTFVQRPTGNEVSYNS